MSDPQLSSIAWRWPAMGTSWQVHHSGRVDGALAQRVADLVFADERRWSRFRSDSELTRINRAAGTPVSVSRETIAIAEACNRWTEATAGVFTPLLGARLAAWGYSRSILTDALGSILSPEGAWSPFGARLEIDAAAGTLRIPEGTLLDLGGIAKSWTAVRAASLLAAECDDPLILVDAGGDLAAARGEHVVRVEGRSFALRLPEGHGAATSGTDRRRWVNGDGVQATHIVDPATGATALVGSGATVISPDPVAADVLATVLTLHPERAAGLAEACRAQRPDGSVVTSTAWASAVVDAPVTWEVTR